MLEKYGSHISATDQYKEKLRTTSIKKYGVDHPFKSDIIKSKIKNKNIEVYGVDNVMKLSSTVEKGLRTKEERGIVFKWSEEELKSFEVYRKKVTYYSNKNYMENINTINPENKTRGHLTYHLDHIYPVILGFVNNIDAELISDYKNLQILPHNENRSKSDNTDMTVDDFYRLINLSKNQFTS